MTTTDVGVYRHLLGSSPTSASDVSRDTGTPFRDVRSSLASLERLGLLRRSAGTVTALDPRATLVPLARQRQSALDAVASVADELASLRAAHRTSIDPDDLVQVLVGADEIMGRLVSMFSGATDEVVSLVAPPYVSDLDPGAERAESAMIERGVRIRAVYDTSFVRDAAHLDNLRAGVRGGEQARLYEGLTTKLVLVDRSVALLPLRDIGSGDPRALLVAHSSLTDALSLLFEQLWQQSTPTPARLGTRGDDPDQAMIELLSTGMVDATVARALGWSERTVRRRIAALQARHQAGSRFQLGWHLGRERRD